MEWLKPRFERFRQASLKRIRTHLELPDGLEGYNLANLGIYGLGKRRSLKQLATFTGIDFESKSSRPETVRTLVTPSLSVRVVSYGKRWVSFFPDQFHCSLTFILFFVAISYRVERTSGSHTI